MEGPVEEGKAGERMEHREGDRFAIRVRARCAGRALFTRRIELFVNNISRTVGIKNDAAIFREKRAGEEAREQTNRRANGNERRRI